MPRKTNVQSQSKDGVSSMPRPVNITLSDEQKAIVKANVPTLKYLFEQIEELTADNYKLTISYDDTTDSYAVYLIGKDNQVTNKGMMLSAYAPVLGGALAMLLYKHQTVCEGDWGKKSPANMEAVWR